MKSAPGAMSLLAISLLTSTSMAQGQTEHNAIFDDASTEAAAVATKKPKTTITLPFFNPRDRSSEEQDEPTSTLFTLSPSSAIQAGPGLPRIIPQQGHWMAAHAQFPDGSRVAATDNSVAATMALAPFAQETYRGSQPMYEQMQPTLPMGEYQPHFQAGFQDQIQNWAYASHSPAFPPPQNLLLASVPAGLERANTDASPYQHDNAASAHDAARFHATGSRQRPDAPQGMSDGSYTKLNEYGVPVAYTPDGVAQAAYVSGKWQEATDDALKSGPYVAGDYVGLQAVDAYENRYSSMPAGSASSKGRSRNTESRRQRDSQQGSGGAGGVSRRVFDVATGTYSDTGGATSGASRKSGTPPAGDLLAQSGLPADMQSQIREASADNPELQSYLQRRNNMASQADSLDDGLNPDGTLTAAKQAQLQATSNQKESKQDMINAIVLCGTNPNMALNQKECMDRVKKLCKYDWKKHKMSGPSACNPFIKLI